MLHTVFDMMHSGDEASEWLDRTVMKWGDRGKLMLPELVHMQLKTFLIIWIPLLIVVLVAIDRLSAR